MRNLKNITINICLCIALAATSSMFGQESKPATAAIPTTSEADSPTFIEVLKKAVVFLQTDCSDQNGVVTNFSSTAFFFGKEDERLGKGKGFSYLVTNRHAAQPGVEHGNPCHVSNYSLRINLKLPAQAQGPKSTVVSLGPSVPWVYSSDPSVDLAVVPFGLDQNIFDFNIIPYSFLATRDVVKTQKIQEGDQVIFTGFFYQVPGLLKLEPIVRQGIVAMMPTEPIRTTLGPLGSLYLADLHVFGGNSGSPLFVNTAGFRNGSMSVGISYRLLGIVSGYEFEDTDFTLQPATTYSGKLGANSGVTTIVPAEELANIINSPALLLLRDQAVSQQIR